MSSFGKFVLGTLVGGAIGAVIGLLLAPRSGHDTRTMIKEEFTTRYNDSVDSLKEKADAVRSRITEQSNALEEVGRRTLGQLATERTAVADSTES